MEKKIKIGLVVLISIMILIILFSSNKISIKKDVAEDILIYEKKASWGPCANPNGGCFLFTSLYSSGRLVLESLETKELQLTVESVDTIITKIKNSGIMGMQCDAPRIVDYSATYNFNVEGETKTIYFPGCENELNTIDAVIETEKKNAEAMSGIECNELNDFDKVSSKIIDLIEKENYCNEDSDCIISESHYMQSDGKYCSFGCYDLFNKNADLSQIKTAISKFYVSCGPCDDYDCPEIPTQSDIICSNNKCVEDTSKNVGVCGNGILEPGEECDDGNLITGDGCDSSCQIEQQVGDSLTLCQQDSDCVLVYPIDNSVSSCCWGCLTFSVNKNERERYDELFSQECKEIECPPYAPGAACFPQKAVCVNNECQAIPEPI